MIKPDPKEKKPTGFKPLKIRTMFKGMPEVPMAEAAASQLRMRGSGPGDRPATQRERKQGGNYGL